MIRFPSSFRPSLRGIALAAAGAALSFGTPASAQFFFSAPDLSSPPVTGAEPELGLNLPGATPAELQAALVWNMRVAMNVAALQCDFEPSLLTVSNYNATIAHHKTELAGAYSALEGYFQRTVARGNVGMRAMDKYNTRLYATYSTVHAQRDFCSEMSRIGRETIFAPRGTLLDIARKRLGEIRKALVPTGDRYFTNPAYNYQASLPSLGKKCWKKSSLKASCAKSWEKDADSAADKQG